MSAFSGFRMIDPGLRQWALPTRGAFPPHPRPLAGRDREPACQDPRTWSSGRWTAKWRRREPLRRGHRPLSHVARGHVGPCPALRGWPIGLGWRFMNLACGDSLLHGGPGSAVQTTIGVDIAEVHHAYQPEDFCRCGGRKILTPGIYHAVVVNPPYIVPFGDPAP